MAIFLFLATFRIPFTRVLFLLYLADLYNDIKSSLDQIENIYCHVVTGDNLPPDLGINKQL
jgi:hypothetical protein